MEESERVSFTICSHCLRLRLASYLLIYCLPGCEGLTHDSRVLEDATSKGFEQFKLLRQRYVGNKVMRLCAVPHIVFAPRLTHHHYYSHPTRYRRLKVPILKLGIGRCRQGRMISSLLPNS